MTGIGLRAAVIAAVSTAAIVLASPAQATHPAKNGLLAFARQIPSGNSIKFIANPNGSDVRQVPLKDPAEDWAVPIWSPDGTRLLISNLHRNTVQRTFRPAIVNPDGSGYRVLEVPEAPADMGMFCALWTSDGARILCKFDGDASLPTGIFSIRSSDGGGLVRLTTNRYGGSDDPTDLSPDGKRFVFLRHRFQDTSNEQAALFTAKLDGTRLRRITPYGLPQPHENESAQWSPNGKEIISETTQGRLFVVRPDGTHLTLIKLEMSTNQYFAFEPHWSPDGKRLVFCAIVNGQDDLYMSGVDGAHVVRITNTPDFENGPDWQPVT
jgi:Tol biopolymer transport system component